MVILSGGGRASILLICNDLTLGRALGRACVAAGIAPPAWVVTSGVPGRPIMSFDVTVAIPEPGTASAAQLAGLAAGGPVIVVGERLPRAGDALEWVAPGPGWDVRVVDRLIDRLGLTPALLPSYENRLRVLGRELDRRGYPAVSIVETPEGFDVRPEAPEDAHLDGFGFNDPDFGRLAREAMMARGEEPWERPTGRLAPSGHERTLRALGWDLDARGASRVRIVPLAQSLVVSGLQAASPYDAPEPFRELFRAEHLRDLERRTAQGRREPDSWLARLKLKLGVDV